MKYIIFFNFLIISLFANSLTVEEKYFIDSTNRLSIENIIQEKKNFLSLNKYNLGITEDNVWVNIEIKNNTSSFVFKRVYNKRIGINFIDIYLVSKDTIQSFFFGDMISYNKKHHHNRIPYFDLKLNPYETINIYIKHKSYAPLEVKWNVSSMEEFHSFDNIQSNLYFIFLGALSVATIVSLIFFIITKELHYLIYSLFTICNIIFQFSIAGFFNELQLPLYIHTVFTFSFPLFTIILLGLFPLYFFQLCKIKYKYTTYVIYFFNWLLFGVAVLNMFYPINYDILYLIQFTNILIILFFTFLTILSIVLYKNGIKGSVFYMLSNILAWFGIIYHILSVMGILSISSFHYFSLAFSSMSQDIFLAVALVHTSYLIKKEHEKNNQLLNEYSKLSFIGQTMLNISHQWKSPINKIFNSINHIEVAKKFNDPNLDIVIDKNLSNIKQTAIFLKNTALNQLDFYKSHTKKEKINIYDEIHFIVKLIENEFSKKAINITFNFDKNLEIIIDKNYFLNVLMILFENSYKLFEQRNIKNPFITIKAFYDKDNFELQFEDNAQGAKDDIDKIFDKNYSMSNSTGLGLYLAKEIVEYKLHGTINSENKNKGICFKIVLKDKEKKFL